MTTLKIVGIAVGTTNQNGQSALDIGQLWGRFYAENIADRIPNKTSNEIYTVYTDYESDYKGRYVTLIGVNVNSLDDIPEGLTGREFLPQKFRQYTAKGTMPAAVVKTWQEIWENDNILQRSYLYDYEVYGDKCQQGENPEVDIFVGIKAD